MWFSRPEEKRGIHLSVLEICSPECQKDECTALSEFPLVSYCCRLDLTHIYGISRDRRDERDPRPGSGVIPSALWGAGDDSFRHVSYSLVQKGKLSC
jgi:hypothetical protein